MRRTWLALGIALSACTPPPAPTAAPAPSAGPSEVRVTGEPVDAKRWLAPDAARAISAGAGALRVLGADVVAEGERIGAFVEIPEGECALAFTRGSPGVGDVDLFAYDDDGSAFATDESPEREAAILLCPPHPRRLFVVARVMAGSGIVGVGVQSVPPAAADAVAKLLGVRGRPGEDSGRLDAWPGLEARVRARRDALGGKWDDVRRVALPVSPRAATHLSASIDAGRCLDLLVVPSDEITALEVTAEDAEARVIARAKDRGRERSLLFCAPPKGRATPINVAIRPRGPQGIVAAIFGRSAVGAEPEIEGHARVTHVGDSLELTAARAAIATATSGLGYAAPKAIGAGAAKVGSRAAFSVALPPGCARLDVIAGKPLVEMAASLWDDRGTLLTEGRAAASVALFTCGKGGAARVDLEALESPGPFAIELRRDNAAPPALVAHPVAAARLLSRLASGGEAADASMAATATVVGLEEGQRKIVPVPLPASGCADVIAALDGNASGIDLRIADGSGSGDGSVARARYLVSDRVCGAPNGKPVTAELKLASGKTEALVLVRPVAVAP